MVDVRYYRITEIIFIFVLDISNILLYHRDINKTKGLNMTLKQIINKWFEDKVIRDDEYSLYHEQDFWGAWDEFDDLADSMGVQWFEWYDDQPTISDLREKFVKQAIDNYIKKALMPIYTNKQ